MLYIMERLSKQSCTTKQLALEIYGCESESKRRIIQSDIKVLKEHFNGLIVSAIKGEYKFAKLPSFIENFAQHEGIELHDLLEFMAIVDNKMLSYFQKSEPALVGRIKRDVKRLYAIHEPPFELLQSPFLDKIKKAIKYRQYVNIGYKEQILERLQLMQIHRIIYAKGNWYIAGFSHKHRVYNGFRFMRINFIDSFELLPNTFKRDLQVEHFIDNFQSLFTLYQEPTYEAKIRVSKEVMRHFKAKKYLKSQKLLKEDQEGVILSYQISCNMEIIPLIKQWIPHIQVLSPEHLKKQLIQEVQTFLANQ